MKLLHFWREDELFEINFEIKWKQLANKRSPTNIFCRAWRIKLDRMPTKVKWKIPAYFILFFNFEKVLQWKVITYRYQVFYFLLYISFNIRYQQNPAILYWFYMFNLYNFIFQRLIWKMTPTPISHIPALIPRIPLIPFPSLLFRPFQILTLPKLKFIVDLKFNLVL